MEDIFNSMAGEYDDLSDLWYSWLFSRLHYIITKNVICTKLPQKVLDVGCGTGLQSYLFASAGCKVIGFDIAEDLVEIAKQKGTEFQPYKFELFPVYHEYVSKYNKFMRANIKKKIPSLNYCDPEFYTGDATNISYPDNTFDHVNCCGSVLSFIPNYKKALSEISRVLVKNGTFLVEVEGKWSFNIIYQLLDPLFRGKFELNTKFKEALKFITKKPTRNITIDFPFGDYKNPVHMNLKLFTSYSLKRLLKYYGLMVEKKWAIHSLTNLIPCTYLDNLKPSTRLKKAFNFLARLEERLPFYVPGSSLVLFGRKIA
ncbi:MAG: class I SAM-dependent methyltransferase [Candidatus Lokiarchaeota archaeon]|nr:class I SAM-dependent methyltransferase [Candidatus Lokiarchaeota archaeon]